MLISAGMNLMRRLPPRDTERSIAAISSCIVDDEQRALFEEKVDQPLQQGEDEAEGKPYLLCENNRDGDCYRSPWSNQYFPNVSESGEAPQIYPSDELRDMEKRANAIFARYAKLYYDENFVTSVYFFDIDGSDSSRHGFGSAWLVKKQGAAAKNVEDAMWDATHVVTTSVDEANGKAKYRVNSAVFFQLDANNAEGYGQLDCGCSVLAVKEETFSIDSIDLATGDLIGFHIKKIGRMIEDNEG